MEVHVRATGAVMFEDELRRWLHQTGGPSYDALTPEVMEAIGVDPVLEGPQPAANRYQTVYRNGVEQISGQWFTKYALADMSDEAKAALDARQAESVRDDRNKRLADCDWTQLVDAPCDKSVWATYRQALRDITGQSGFPWEVTWPEKP